MNDTPSRNGRVRPSTLDLPPGQKQTRSDDSGWVLSRNQEGHFKRLFQRSWLNSLLVAAGKADGFKWRAYFFATFFLGALAWSFLEFLLKIKFSRRASSNFHKTSCFSVKLLQISIKNPLKLRVYIYIYKCVNLHVGTTDYLGHPKSLNVSLRKADFQICHRDRLISILNG